MGRSRESRVSSFFGRPQRESLKLFGLETLSETGRHHGVSFVSGPEVI
jgi:hypothetical protein